MTRRPTSRSSRPSSRRPPKIARSRRRHFRPCRRIDTFRQVVRILHLDHPFVDAAAMVGPVPRAIIQAGQLGTIAKGGPLTPEKAERPAVAGRTCAFPIAGGKTLTAVCLNISRYTDNDILFTRLSFWSNGVCRNHVSNIFRKLVKPGSPSLSSLYGHLDKSWKSDD